MTVEHLTDENFYENTSSGVVLVDFFATWCGPCKLLGPTVEEIADESDGSYKVFKVDIDDAEDTAIDFDIMSVPTLAILKDGEEVGRMVGVQPKAAIIEAVKSFIG